MQVKQVIEQKKERRTQKESDKMRERVEIQDGRSISLVCADAAEPLHGGHLLGGGAFHYHAPEVSRPREGTIKSLKCLVEQSLG